MHVFWRSKANQASHADRTRQHGRSEALKAICWEVGFYLRVRVNEGQCAATYCPGTMLCLRVLENAMKSLFHTPPTAALVALALCLAIPRTFAQVAPDVVGSWSLVSLTVSRSGTPVEVLGPHPRGQLIFGSDGRYVLVGVRADLPKFA
jgi:hypothetical protein